MFTLNTQSAPIQYSARHFEIVRQAKIKPFMQRVITPNMAGSHQLYKIGGDKKPCSNNSYKFTIFGFSFNPVTSLLIACSRVESRHHDGVFWVKLLSSISPILQIVPYRKCVTGFVYRHHKRTHKFNEFTATS